ncbi:P-loop containing nucleoside triphosphate hydrolase protein [Kalaharituber pfeilii]|nr:P-loop containing nucleoside triphosphate hydrolase protein [Kalaharituber pfeilii]
MPRQPVPHASTSCDSLPPLHATSQQTRFHLNSATTSSGASRDLDIPGVTLTLGHSTEILVDAHIKLAAGARYVLVGRNGVGKSTLLRALGTGVIPGMEEGGWKVALLQQMERQVQGGSGGGITESGAAQRETVLEYVVKSDVEREKLLRRAELLRKAIDDTTDHVAAVRALRQIQHEDRLARLHEAQKLASLRSGARGMKARKELLALEVEVETELTKLSLLDSTPATTAAIALLADIESALESISASETQNLASALLQNLGFSTSLLNTPVSALSSGMFMRTKLASLLLRPNPNTLLLLDEPTNYLDLPSLLWLTEHLTTALPSTCILVVITHDRAFADDIGEHVLILKDRALTSFHGTLSSYLHSRAVERKRLQKLKAAQDKQVAHIESTISSQLRAARVSGDDKKLKQAVSRKKKLEERTGVQTNARGGKFKLNRDLAGYHLSRRAEIEIPPEEAAAKLAVPRSPRPELRFPGPLVSVEGLSWTYAGAKTPVLKNVTLTIHPGDRLGLVGLNGAGKSTLVNVLADRTPPLSVGRLTAGTVTRHPKARIGYFSQSEVDKLDCADFRTQTALVYLAAGRTDTLSDPASAQLLRGLLSSLGLSGHVVSGLPLSQLSGGQKVRVALAKMLYLPVPHMLVLDEVTTHLDADSVMALAEEIRKFKGAVVVVSHDRWFVKVVVEGKRDGKDGDWDGSDESEESEEEEDAGSPGRVYLVGGGNVELLEGGVAEFEQRLRGKKRKGKKK